MEDDYGTFMFEMISQPPLTLINSIPDEPIGCPAIIYEIWEDGT